MAYNPDSLLLKARIKLRSALREAGEELHRADELITLMFDALGIEEIEAHWMRVQPKHERTRTPFLDAVDARENLMLDLQRQLPVSFMFASTKRTGIDEIEARALVVRGISGE